VSSLPTLPGDHCWCARVTAIGLARRRRGDDVPVARSRMDRVARSIERSLMAVGVTCLLWAGTSWLSGVVYRIEQSVLLEQGDHTLDRHDGDRAAIVGVAASESPVAIGRLEIRRIGLSAVVAEGDDEKTLKVAVGHLSDTPLPWQEGNTALAGHRDTFFRPLRRIRTGDQIDLATRYGTFRYRVTRLTVVNPDEVWVLEPSAAAALTLITCYPFDFIGPAPRRFVVHAERITNANDTS